MEFQGGLERDLNKDQFVLLHFWSGQREDLGNALMDELRDDS